MTAYSFKARFVEPILASTKGGTIRATRSIRNQFSGRLGGHARPGEELQLYTGMRTKYCRLIARKTCLSVEPITLVFDPGWWIRLGSLETHRDIKDYDLNAFARFDGFADWPEMMRFWMPARYFVGWHIRWMELPEDVPP